MRYESIQAANMKQAIIKIHESYGADAMICRTRKTVGGIEILVGIQDVEEAEEELTSDLDDLFSEKLRQLVESPVITDSPKPVVKERRVKRVLRGIGGGVKRIFTFRRKSRPRKEKAKAKPYNISGITSKFEMRIFRKKQTQTVNAFVGPSGSGKTTTLIKLVIQYMLNYSVEDIGIISTNIDDLYMDSKLKRFCHLYHLDFTHVNTVKELNTALKSMKSKKLILIDTHGISQRDFAAVSKTRYMLEKAVSKIAVYLVMPASYQPEIIGDAIKYYSFKSIQGCVLTKADEILNLEPVLEIFALADIQVTYVCNGEDLDKDIYTMKQDENLLEFSLDKYSEMKIPQFNNQSANW